MLSSVKIAGFKSFADPVSIDMRHRLVGIVGPNGCGKSNVADALRWVLGEGSHKSLRVDTMGAIIFSGTRSRKALSRADVELKFDNSSGFFGGEYARYNEVSVRREVFADGQSRYYLNGVLCRRRDISALFLGTGLGAPSYAIVQQGMISRLIEASPSEMRLYLEEAAGISYFRKQKQEADSHLRRTRENLEHVNQRLSEIKRNISRLNSQARQAIRHRELNEESQQLRAHRYRSQIESFKNNMVEIEAQIRNIEDGLVQTRLDRDKSALQIDKQRQHIVGLRQDLDQATEEYYQTVNLVTTLEKDIDRGREEIKENKVGLIEAEKSKSEIHSHYQSDLTTLDQLEQATQGVGERYEKIKQTCELSSQEYQECDANLERTRQLQNEARQRIHSNLQQIEMNADKLRQLERDSKNDRDQIAAQKQRHRRLTDELKENDLEKLKNIHHDNRAKLERCKDDRIRQERESRQTNSSLQARTEELAGSQEKLQTLTSRLSELKAIQEAEFGRDPGEAKRWLNNSRWSKNKHLRSLIKVSPGWELAAELVLSRLLNAVYTEIGLDDLHQIPDFNNGELIFLLKSRPDRSAAANDQRIRLGRFIRGPDEIQALLANCFVADDLGAAVEILNEAPTGASVVMRDGVWLSRQWVRVWRKSKEPNLFIVREQEINQLTESRKRLHREQERLKSEIQELNALRSRQDKQNNNQRERIDRLQNETAQSDARLTLANVDLQQKQVRLDEVELGLKTLEGALAEKRDRYRTITQKNEELEKDLARRNKAVKEYDQALGQLSQATAAAQELWISHREKLRSAQWEHDQEKKERSRLHDSVGRLQSELRSIDLRIERIQTRNSELTADIDNCQEKLGKHIAGRDETHVYRLEIERELDETTLQIERAGHALNKLNREIESGNDDLSSKRVKLTERQSEHQHLTQLLAELKLPENLTIADEILELTTGEIEAKIDRNSQKMERMGPLNLVAENEYREQKERADDLEKQIDDLEQSCTSLYRTMKEMSKEITEKYNATLKSVNTHLKEYFIKMFSGGEAWLKEAEDDNDNKGVLFMAQPPGKRIANIHQLSGGERALAAIALMFAFFQLNPAPFCLLDEVDAPLDDINTHRYCQLLSTVKKLTQFIVISHNKITMSNMHALYGITMPVAGVSRVVDVDLNHPQPDLI